MYQRTIQMRIKTSLRVLKLVIPFKNISFDILLKNLPILTPFIKI